MCSTADLSIDAFSYTKCIEQIDVDAIIPSQEDLVLENDPTHLDNGSQTKIISLNQGMLGLLEDNITLHSEAGKSDNHKEGEEIISQKDPKVSQVKEGVILNEAYFLNSLGQLLFEYPFFVSLETFKARVKHARNSLWQRLKKIWGATIQKKTKWEWLASIPKKWNKINHLVTYLIGYTRKKSSPNECTSYVNLY